MPGLDDLKRKARRRRIETILLAGYAFAVTCALFVSLLSKNSLPQDEEQKMEDTFDYTTDVLTPVYRDSEKDNPFELVYMQVNNLKLLSDNVHISDKISASRAQNNIVMPISAKPVLSSQAGSFEGIYQKEHRVVVVSSGDSFIGILTKLGMEGKSATLAYQALKKVYDARNLKVGQHIELTAVFDVQTKQLETLDTLVIEPVRGTKYILQVNEYDEFEAKVEQEKFVADVKEVNGKIKGYVSTSLNSAGVPKKLCGKVTQLFAQAIDFGRDIKKGDSFSVKYEVEKDAQGEVVNVGDILYASFTVGKETFKRYRFKSRNGDIDYYDENGGARKTGLDKKPLAMKNARISSMFGYRRHPIYKTTKYHSGVDYAAPQGTAIYASGAGVIEMARYVNGYGNFIKIRHNSEYETAYAHMHKFASGMKPGVRVRKGQIIGYVGSTGRSTGPHLHFEILKKGQRIDPLKAKVATGTDLTGSQLAEFKRAVQKIDQMVAKETVKKEVAAKEKTADVKVAENTVAEKVVSDAGKVVKIPDAAMLATLQNDTSKVAEKAKDTPVAAQKEKKEESEIAVVKTEKTQAEEAKTESSLPQKLGDIFGAKKETEASRVVDSVSASSDVEVKNTAESHTQADEPVETKSSSETVTAKEPSSSEEEVVVSTHIKPVAPVLKSAESARSAYFRKKWPMIDVPAKKPAVKKSASLANGN